MPKTKSRSVKRNKKRQHEVPKESVFDPVIHIFFLLYLFLTFLFELILKCSRSPWENLNFTNKYALPKKKNI